jgi:uncharacterized membrane protein YfcA
VNGLDCIPFLITGFIAELVDSSLGMAYGVLSNSILLSMGLSAALSSATIHSAEVFLIAASGISHLRLGNFDRELFLSLLIPGMISAILGAYVLSSFDTSFISPLIQTYLIIMGVLIILRSRKHFLMPINVKPAALGLLGGFLDATGGGGWGPVVTGTLVANGSDVKKTVGSVNIAEFFITLSQTITFIALTKINWQYTLLVLLGGLPSAVIGAYIVRAAKREKLMIMVGAIIIIVNLYSILRKFYL